MSSWLGYASVHSVQDLVHQNWCRRNALGMAEDVDNRVAAGGGDEWAAQARRDADAFRLTRHHVREELVSLASSGDSEVVSFGYDVDGLLVSVVFHPARVLAYEPLWVPRRLQDVFVSLLDILEQTPVPFGTPQV
jgi:hypothetical protein